MACRKQATAWSKSSFDTYLCPERVCEYANDSSSCMDLRKKVNAVSCSFCNEKQLPTTHHEVPSYQSLRIAGLDWLILLLSLDAIGWSTGSLIPSFYSWLLFISDDGR